MIIPINKYRICDYHITSIRGEPSRTLGTAVKARLKRPTNLVHRTAFLESSKSILRHNVAK